MRAHEVKIRRRWGGGGEEVGRRKDEELRYVR